MTPSLTLLALTVVAITATAVVYAAWCYLSPYGRCTSCRMTPGDHFCRRCDGTGLRRRIGWRLLSAYRRHLRDATAPPPTSTAINRHHRPGQEDHRP